MVRHPTERLSDPVSITRKRIVPAQLDEDGVLHLEAAFLAGLRDGDALGMPHPLPTCESCWAEPAAAVALGPCDTAMFRGAACISTRQALGVRLVALVPS
jgi:hypothetical protein